MNIVGLRAREREPKAFGAMGVAHDRHAYCKIVVGPGASRKYADLCREMGLLSSEADGNWQANKAAHKQVQGNSRINSGLKVLAGIFVSLIPGIIVAGLYAGFASLLTHL